MRIVVTGKNQAPEVAVAASAPLTVEVNSITSIDFLTLSDPDFGDVDAFTDSYGFAQLPPITLRVTVKSGYLYFESTDDVSVLITVRPDATGANLRTLEVYGPIDKVNTALTTLKYQCDATAGCYAGLGDVLTLVVDDGGYTGQGGALQTTVDIPIKVLAGV
jgi:hypothetical protein